VIVVFLEVPLVLSFQGKNEKRTLFLMFLTAVSPTSSNQTG